MSCTIRIRRTSISQILFSDFQRAFWPQNNIKLPFLHIFLPCPSVHTIRPTRRCNKCSSPELSVSDPSVKATSGPWGKNAIEAAATKNPSWVKLQGNTWKAGEVISDNLDCFTTWWRRMNYPSRVAPFPRIWRHQIGDVQDFCCTWYHMIPAITYDTCDATLILNPWLAVQVARACRSPLIKAEIQRVSKCIEKNKKHRIVCVHWWNPSNSVIHHPDRPGINCSGSEEKPY